MRTIVCHGDSLTEGSDLDIGYTWTHLVENRLDVKVVNSGIGGDTSGGLLARFYPDVIRHTPDMVIILGGTNDLWWNLDVKQILANIFAMACQARFHKIVPVVGLPLPLYMENILQQDMMEPIAGWDNCIPKLADLVASLASAAKASDIASLDFYHPFLDVKGAILGQYYLADGLHPNKQGHRLMAEKMVQFLRDRFYYGS